LLSCPRRGKIDIFTALYLIFANITKKGGGFVEVLNFLDKICNFNVEYHVRSKPARDE
jgi:hypothetical protein